MKRKASKAASVDIPAKLSKRSSTSTISRHLSGMRRTGTTPKRIGPPPKFPSVTKRSRLSSTSASLSPPAWPALVPTSKAKKDSVVSMTDEMTEVSEEPEVPGLRRMSTLPLEDDAPRSESVRKERSMSRSSSLGRKKSSAASSAGVAAVAVLEKKGSVVALEASGTVTTVTRLASGSSVGKTVALSAAPPSIRKELSKASSNAKAHLTKKLSSIRVYGSDDPNLLLPPGGLIEIAFSFDTTGSMSSCIDEVRGRVGDMIQRLQADIPGIRIAVIAHGDYCDEDNYVIKWIDFGASLPELSDFVQTISATAGGDFDECYELVLARAATELSWTPGSQRSLVMIGDATPHPFHYYASRAEKLDWEEETRKLAAMDVKIYSVQAMNRSESTHFYRTMANVTKGRHLQLAQFNNIFDIIMAVCYNEKGAEFVQAYEDEVRTREGGTGLHKDLEGLFSDLRGGKKTTVSTSTAKLSKGAAKGKASATKGRAPGVAKKALAKGKATAKGKGKATVKHRAKKPKGKAGTKAKTCVHGKKICAVKGKKATKKKAPAKKSKKLVPGVKRKFREAVKDEEFDADRNLKKVDWEPWVKALTPFLPRPRGRGSGIYKQRNMNATSASRYRYGRRNVKLCQFHEHNAPAVYEFAVKLKRKMYVVYFKTLCVWRKNVMWDTRLMMKPEIDDQVHHIVRYQLGEIWMRKGIVHSQDTLKEVRKHLSKNYDYAWQKRQGRKGGHVRRVKKCGVLISSHRE